MKRHRRAISGLTALVIVITLAQFEVSHTRASANRTDLCSTLPASASPTQVVPVATPDEPPRVDLFLIDAMAAHHAGAITMGNVALQQAQDLNVRRMALRIVESQAGEIQLLRYWRDNWYPGAEQLEIDPFPHAGTVHDLCAAVDDFDRVFLKTMIAHHRAAILMVENALTGAEHPELVDFAASTIEARSEEVLMMARWLTGMEATPRATP